MILAKQFDDAASRALTRTIVRVDTAVFKILNASRNFKHITDAGLRDAVRKGLVGPGLAPLESTRPTDPDEAILEETTTEDDLTSEESMANTNGANIHTDTSGYLPLPPIIRIG